MPNVINLDKILMEIMELLYKLKCQKSYWIGASGNQLSVPRVSFYVTHALPKKHINKICIYYTCQDRFWFLLQTPDTIIVITSLHNTLLSGWIHSLVQSPLHTNLIICLKVVEMGHLTKLHGLPCSPYQVRHYLMLCYQSCTD